MDKRRRRIGGGASGRSRFWVAIVVTLGLTAAGTFVGLNFTMPAYRATVAVDIGPNLGGMAVNSYTDASVQSVQWVQTSMLNNVRRRLTGNALADPDAIYRMRCGRDSGDSVVICSTTSENERAARAVLNQMVKIVVPLESVLLEQSYRLGIQERQEQRAQLTRRDMRLQTSIQRLQTGAKTAARSRMLAFDTSALSVNASLRRDIATAITSIRRQIIATPHSFRTLNGGATVSKLAGFPWWIAGSGAGLCLGLLLNAMMLLGSATYATSIPYETNPVGTFG